MGWAVNIAHVKDVAFCTGWYTYSQSQVPDPGDYNKSLKAPYAFAVIPRWETQYPAYYNPTVEQFTKAGGTPIVWKESSHGQKYGVQLWMKETGLEPTNTGMDYPPSFACSTCWLTFDVPKVFTVAAFPTAPHKFGAMFSQDNLKIVRLARPIAKDALAYFKADPMWVRCCKTKWHQYWAWGYLGLCDNAKCKY
jgi:hypothetical protein